MLNDVTRCSCIMVDDNDDSIPTKEVDSALISPMPVEESSTPRVVRSYFSQYPGTVSVNDRFSHAFTPLEPGSVVSQLHWINSARISQPPSPPQTAAWTRHTLSSSTICHGCVTKIRGAPKPFAPFMTDFPLKEIAMAAAQKQQPSDSFRDSTS